MRNNSSSLIGKFRKEIIKINYKYEEYKYEIIFLEFINYEMLKIPTHQSHSNLCNKNRTIC